MSVEIKILLALNEAPRGRFGREAARAMGFRRKRCGLAGSLQRPRRGFGLWLAVGIAIQQFDHPPLLAQQGPPSSADTTVVEIDVSGSAASGSSSFAIVDARLTFERSDSVFTYRTWHQRAGFIDVVSSSLSSRG